MASLRHEFEESTLPITVDVLDWHRISPEFRKNIEKQYETIQKSHENTIPEGWTIRKISEIAEVVGGGTPRTKHAFGDICGAFNELITSNARESRILAELRDTLLPKLISGELRVSQAEGILAEAGA